MQMLKAEGLIDRASSRSDPSEISNVMLRAAGWETARLRCHQTLPGANVDLSQVYRVYIATDDHASSPQSMIVKLPVADSEKRRREAASGAYMREAMALQMLGSLQGRTLPRAHVAVVDEIENTSAMLYEDLGAPMSRQTWNLRTTIRALKQLAQMHTLHWENQDLETYWWMRSSRYADIFGEDPDLFAIRWEELTSSTQSAFYDSDELVNVAEHLKTCLEDVLEELDARPKTLSHGDLHKSNVMYRLSDGRCTGTVIIDWQAAVFGGCSSDIAKILATAPAPEIVSNNETLLLESYHQSLPSNIRATYPLERLVRDYRLALMATFANYVIAADTEDVSSAPALSINRSLRSVARLVECARPLEKLMRRPR